MMKTISANGLSLPALGQGGWTLGDDPQKSRSEIAALRCGIELGMNLIDTAEMYGDGRSESLIGKAIKGIRREDVLLISKVYPHNADRSNIFTSCDASLKRLGTDYLDLYLLHWRGTVPLAETVECMERLVYAKKICRWGVSNFDVADMEELVRVPCGENCAVDQVLYHLGSRGIEYDLLPWLAERGMAAIAYCPLAQAGRLKRMNKEMLTDRTVLSIAQKYHMNAFQVLLAFTLRRPNVISIPKAGSREHIEQNAAVLDISISNDDWAEIDKAFGPPTSKMHLDIE
jgi:diketogulonate reductase-like aldo/keto reductase